MKKIVIVIILAVYLLTACSNNEIEYNSIEQTNQETEPITTPIPINKMSTEDIILNYLDGDWVEYDEPGRKYTYLVKSINEIYSSTSGIPQKDFFDAVEQGEWDKENIVITEDGFEIQEQYDDSSISTSKYTFDFSKVENNNFNDIILHMDFYFNNELLFSNDYVRPGKEYIQLEPAIGMTHEEVKASTWGEPYDINKTTYSWGTTEQWCYSGYRYIYFENGIVTAIQE